MNSINPLNIIKEAIRAVPAVKYALGIAGIVSALAIIGALVVDVRKAVFGTIIMLILMVMLVIFAKLCGMSKEYFKIPILIFTYVALTLTILSACFLFTSVFFQWPIPLLTSILTPPIAPTPAPTFTPTITPTLTPTPTATVEPTPTLTPTTTPTPTATIEPTPTLTPETKITPTIRPTLTPIVTATPTVTPTIPFSSEFRINGIIVKDTKGNTIKSVNKVYPIELGQTITMTIDFTKPYGHEVGIIWTTHYGKVPPINDKTNTYTATKVGGDAITVYIRDKTTGERLYKSILVDITSNR